MTMSHWMLATAGNTGKVKSKNCDQIIDQKSIISQSSSLMADILFLI